MLVDIQDLDVSWLKEQERLEKINQNYPREPMENIHLYFVFINCNNYIEYILKEKITDCSFNHNNENVVLKEDLLKLIERQKKHNYFLVDTILYNVTIDSKNIQSFSQCSILNTNRFIKIFPGEKIQDINIPPSIFIFHNINSIFFIFQEKNVSIEDFVPKSIIKKDKGGTTKKVRIVPYINNNMINKKNRMTKRKYN